MTLQIISDVHLEFLKEEPININKFLSIKGDYLCILGDLGNPCYENYKEFISQASNLYKKVFVITGNHEYYSTEINPPNMEETDKNIETICNKFINVIFLNNSSYELDENTLILGTTLWSCIPENKKYQFKDYLNDYSYIYKNNKGYVENIKPDDTNNLFNRNVLWLQQSLLKEKNKEKNIIVLTHYLPTFKLIHTMYEGDEMNYGFASNLDYLIEQNSNIRYWFCGHTHKKVKAKISNCELFTNPVGYKNENEEYDPEFCIKI